MAATLTRQPRTDRSPDVPDNRRVTYSKRDAQHEPCPELASEPQEVQPRYPRHKCEVCGAAGAENHHWAPFFLFGDEAHRWPTFYLCPTCHARWHEVVTPNA